ncbi:hypothetical protein [Streptomyces sp. NPDC091268]|uniref:hypothetical protein n=1 Tax=Streptomyces sp. NPDC091268 TaxID=3365979 RepID=UPI0038041272
MTFPDDRLHHLAGALTHMASRVSDHIERIDHGNVAAIDDLAVTLRSLVGSGKGNGVLLTACRGFGVEYPTLQASRTPVPSGAYMSIGSLPVEEPGAVIHGARQLTLSKWIQEPVLHCSTKSGSASYSWDKFIREYANKWGGAHLDSQVPEELFAIDRHAAAGLVMSTYLLRTAGVAVWGLTQHVLQRTLTVSTEPTYSGILAAPGSNSPKPEYRKQYGQLQWLTIAPDSMDFGWYVDHFSRTNTLLLAFGSIPYDVRYQPEGAEPQGSVDPTPPLGPRRPPLVPPPAKDSLRAGTASGVIMPIQHLQETSSGSADTAES